MTKKTIFILAGEASGDALGARLIHAWQAVQGDAAPTFTGIAGPQMLAAGCKTLFPQDDIALMGLVEILPHIRQLKQRIKQTIEAIIEAKPAAIITIDAPGFNKRVVKRLREKLGDACPPCIHYVAPSVWAWKPQRAKVCAELFDHLLCLLPFEPVYFHKEGLSADFIGHSVLESGAGQGDAERFRAQHDIAANTTIITVLPGSRWGEVSRMLPILRDAAGLLPKEIQYVMPLTPAMAVKVDADDWPTTLIITRDEAEKYNAFAASSAAMAASGTVTLELALAGVPTVVGYQLNALTYWLVKRLVKVPYVSLVNILREQPIIPEFLQQDCTPLALARATEAWLASAEKCAWFQHEAAIAMNMLQPTTADSSEKGEKFSPSMAAVNSILTKFDL